MALYDKKGLPHKGWVLENSIDVEQEYETCEMCGKYPIRYVHYLTHPDCPERVAVGTECASNLTTEYVDYKGIEKKLRGRAQKFSTYIKKEWNACITQNGSKYYSLRYKGNIYKIMPSKFGNSKFGIGVGYGAFNFELNIKTIEEAKKYIFNNYIAKE